MLKCDCWVRYELKQNKYTDGNNYTYWNNWTVLSTGKHIVHVQSFYNHKIKTRSESVSLPGTQFLFIDMSCSDSQNTSLLMFINQYFWILFWLQCTVAFKGHIWIIEQIFYNTSAGFLLLHLNFILLSSHKVCNYNLYYFFKITR